MPVPARPRPPSPPARPDDQLRGHVRLLGTLLGQTLVHQEGEALLELEEAVRAKTKQLRERHDPVVRGPSIASWATSAWPPPPA